jgi:hypothetical protein
VFPTGKNRQPTGTNPAAISAQLKLTLTVDIVADADRADQADLLFSSPFKLIDVSAPFKFDVFTDLG